MAKTYSQGGGGPHIAEVGSCEQDIRHSARRTRKFMIQWFLEYLQWGLEFESISKDQVVMDYIDKAKDGTLGGTHACLGRLAV